MVEEVLKSIENFIKDSTMVVMAKIIIIETTVIFILILEEEGEEIRSYLVMIILHFLIPFFVS